MRFTAIALFLVSFLAAEMASAIVRNRAPASPADADLYAEASAAAEAGDCEKALPLLEQAAVETPDDADVFNLRGYCERKRGDLDRAFASYRRALELRTEFPEARQYLGEAHLQAVRREVEILRGYGEPGREALARLITALREAADGAGTPAAANPAW